MPLLSTKTLHGARLVTTAIMTLAMLALAGCDAEQATQTELATPQLDELELAELAASEAIAQNIIEVELNDYTFTFIEFDGSVAIVEYAPGGAPAILDLLAVEAPTALEVFMAVAADLEPPEALVRDHQRERGLAVPSLGDGSAQGTEANRDLAPILSAIVTTTITDHYDATCNFSADYNTYFVGVMDSLGWDSWWYQYNTPTGNITHISGKTSPTFKLRAHSCNNAVVGSNDNYTFGVRRDSSPGCPLDTVYLQYIEEGYRAVYYQTGASDACVYWAYAVNSVQDVPHSLGIMSP